MNTVSDALCLQCFAHGPADATATHCLLLSKIQIGFTFLVLAHPGSPVKRAIKRVCVCVSDALMILQVNLTQEKPCIICQLFCNLHVHRKSIVTLTLL